MKNILRAHILCKKGAAIKNVTLALDEDTLKDGREYARKHNMSFNAMVGKLIQQTVKSDSAQWLDDTYSLIDKLNVSSENKKWTREELYRV